MVDVKLVEKNMVALVTVIVERPVSVKTLKSDVVEVVVLPGDLKHLLGRKKVQLSRHVN